MYQLSAKELRDLFVSKKVSASEIAEYFIKRAHTVDEMTGAFLTILDERTLKKAKELDEKRASGKPLGKLAGVPIAVKDNMNLKGVKTTCGSNFLKDHVALYDATPVRLLEEEDALIIGKTNCDEFAMGSTNENSAFKIAKNPWDLEGTPGGSSGGSAVAVSARCAPLSLGSDTGGSIRQPAAFTGIFGFKPTYGRVSRYGLVAFGSSLDHVGPFATNVEDIALIMEVMGAYCERDSTSLDIPRENYLDTIDESLQGKKIGVPWDFLCDLPDKSKKLFKESLKVYEDLGAEILEISFPDLKYCIPIYYIIAPAEASSNLARFDGVQYSARAKDAKSLAELYDLSKEYGFGEEVKQRIMLGTFVLSSGFQSDYFKKALKIREMLINNFHHAFDHCDVIALPTTPNGAFKSLSIKDPISLYLQDLYTTPANLAGLPAISIPCGFSGENKPHGLQIIGPQQEDARVMRFAYHFQKNTEHHKKIPSLFDKEELS